MWGGRAVIALREGSIVCVLVIWQIFLNKRSQPSRSPAVLLGRSFRIRASGFHK